MSLKPYKELWKNYLGGKMIYIGGFGLNLGALTNDQTISITSAIFLGSGAIVFEIEKLREVFSGDDV